MTDEKPKVHEHTEACNIVMRGFRSADVVMSDLSAKQRQTIFACPHYSHDVAKLVWRA